MRNTDPAEFTKFAGHFVRAYWQTVKSGDFPMPPNEPVEPTLEELLAAVSYSTETQSLPHGAELAHTLVMTHKLGNWWRFTFRRIAAGWSVVGCSAQSDNVSNPHDLLGAVYSPYFAPFLQHVTHVANTHHRSY